MRLCGRERTHFPKQTWKEWPNATHSRNKKVRSTAENLRGGHLVFENPALSIPENSKAKHPTSILNHISRKRPIRMGQGVVTRSLEAQLFQSQRILKPSTLPHFTSYVLALLSFFGLPDLKKSGSTRTTSESLKIKQTGRHALCQGSIPSTT